MVIQKLNAWRFKLPLIKPLTLKGQSYIFRQGVLLSVQDENGKIGWGEASPLPGVHLETISDVVQALSFIKQKYLPGNCSIASIDDLPGDDNIPASLQFAFHCALWSLSCSYKKMAPAHWINPAYENTITVNALFTADESSPELQIEALYDLGYRSFKLKVGSRSLSDEINRTRKLIDALPQDVTLRLDANCSWDFTTTIEFCLNIPTEKIEYIEEPLKDPSRLSELKKETGFPLALDETIISHPDLLPELLNDVSALILKPSVIGSLKKCKSLTDLCSRYSIYPVFTSAFESGLGLTHVSHLAAALGKQNVAHGLDTWRWLEYDTIETSFRATNGTVHIGSIEFDVRNEFLRDVLL